MQQIWKHFARIALAIVCAVATWGTEILGKNLPTLDAIHSKAETLDAFLDDPALVEQYYVAAAEYYGGTDAFSKASYIAILNQMRQLRRESPAVYAEFAKRAMAPAPARKTLTVTAQAMGFGRDLRNGAWSRAYAAWVKSLFPAKLAVMNLAQPAQSLLALMQEEERRIEAEAPGRRKRDADLGALYRKIALDSDTRPLLQAIVYEYLTTSMVKEQLNSGDADLILSLLTQLRTRPRLAIESLGLPGELAKPLRFLLEETVPSLIADEKIFPKLVVRNQQGTTRYVPVRPFHAFFRAVRMKECIGGCPGNLPDLLHQRWATPALEGATIYHDITHERFRGYVEIIPRTQHSTKQIYGSLSLGAPRLNLPAKGQWPGRDGVTRAKLFDFFVVAALADLPEGWTGLMIGESREGDNAGVWDAAHGSAAVTFGKPLGHASGFRTTDPWTETFARAQMPGTSQQWKYGATFQMVFDGTLPRAGQQTALVLPPLTSYELASKNLLYALPALEPEAIVDAYRVTLLRLSNYRFGKAFHIADGPMGPMEIVLSSSPMIQGLYFDVAEATSKEIVGRLAENQPLETRRRTALALAEFFSTNASGSYASDGINGADLRRVGDDVTLGLRTATNSTDKFLRTAAMAALLSTKATFHRPLEEPAELFLEAIATSPGDNLSHRLRAAVHRCLAVLGTNGRTVVLDTLRTVWTTRMLSETDAAVREATQFAAERIAGKWRAVWAPDVLSNAIRDPRNPAQRARAAKALKADGERRAIAEKAAGWVWRMVKPMARAVGGDFDGRRIDSGLRELHRQPDCAALLVTGT